MIRHIVLLRAEKDVEDVLERLAVFCQSFEGVLCFCKSTNQSIETHVMQGFTHGFTIDFSDSAARNRYVHNAEHQAIGADIVKHCPNGIQDVVVFDMVFDEI